MPPHTTYMRITPHSVLQVRIFTEQPLDAGPRWLIHPTEPALPNVIEAIKHLILPKLREENFAKYGTRAGGSTAKGAKAKKKIKDVVITEGFEISVWLKEVPTRHSLLVKQKQFKETKGRLKGNSTKMTEAATGGKSRDDAVAIPEEDPDEDDIENVPQHRSGSEEAESEDNEVEVLGSGVISATAGNDDKKKLNFKTSYDGFSIWGWTLMLYVRRKDGNKKRGTSPPNTAMMGLSDRSTSGKDKGPSLMEEWISTQAIGDMDLDGEDVAG